jgi:hypothetical protein
VVKIFDFADTNHPVGRSVLQDSDPSSIIKAGAGSAREPNAG